MASPTIDELCEAYLADRSNPHSERFSQHADSLRVHLKAVRAEWGREKVKHFAETSIQTVRTKVEEWRASGLSDHTCRKRISIFKAMFNFALDEGLIKRAHHPVIKTPRSGPARERFIDPDSELRRLLEECERSKTPEHTRLLVIILFLTGVRVGAALSLTWEFVDFDKRLIRFKDAQHPSRRSKKRRGNKPMNDVLYDELRRAHATRDCEHVISWRGKPIRCARHSLVALFKRAGLTDVRTHDIRRSSATYVHNETGGDLSAAAKHIVDTEATAGNHYVIEDPRVHLPAMDAVTSVLDRARANGSAH